MLGCKANLATCRRATKETGDLTEMAVDFVIEIPLHIELKAEEQVAKLFSVATIMTTIASMHAGEVS